MAFYNQSQQICWECQRACGKCSWSKKLEPVAGWIATERDIFYNGHPLKSYKILFCPLFIQD